MGKKDYDKLWRAIYAFPPLLNEHGLTLESQLPKKTKKNPSRFVFTAVQDYPCVYCRNDILSSLIWFDDVNDVLYIIFRPTSAASRWNVR